MLRGAIDLVRQDQIGGWLYSDVGEVDNRVVLAFVDDQCVGSGPLGLMREDLKAAGLGDGRLGFSFGISLQDDADLPRVMVKIDGSDVFLLQQTATIARPELFLPVFTTLDRIEWMRSKGLLAPSEITFLKYIQQLGAFEYSLVQVKIGGARKGRNRRSAHDSAGPVRSAVPAPGQPQGDGRHGARSRGDWSRGAVRRWRADVDCRLDEPGLRA